MPKYVPYGAKHKMKSYKIAKDLLNFAKVAEIRQIWSHWRATHFLKNVEHLQQETVPLHWLTTSLSNRENLNHPFFKVATYRRLMLTGRAHSLFLSDVCPSVQA